jgi:hypothetical protein
VHAISRNWALLIEDDTFLPQIRERGLTDKDIMRYKEELERSGAIRNHHVIGGMMDLTSGKAPSDGTSGPRPARRS